MIKHTETAGDARASHGIALAPTHSSALRYRPDIDGLRAVAVVPVLLYHAFPRIVPGGFIGVDIFFVISGFLITGIIDQQVREKRFSIADFYARRIRRIFPALVLVVLATFVAGWYLLPPLDMQSLGMNIAGGALFAQNFVLLGQVGYFDLAADKKPLLHLWSLGIEEQYYIVWPATLLLLRRFKLNALATVLILAVASFVLCVIVRRHSSADAAFYLPVTRAWELFAGAALALWQKGEHPPEPRTGGAWLLREALTFAAMLAIAIALAKFGPRTSYPGENTLVPVLAAAALLGTRRTFMHRLLSVRPVVFIGLISYPLYLWHFPLMAFARIDYVDSVPRWVMYTILVASFVLAWLTYVGVERPLRFGRARSALKIAGLVSAMATLGAVGLVAAETGGLPSRIPDSIRGFMLTGEETASHWQRGKCLLLPEQGASDFAPECAGADPGRRPLLLIWGDSYGAALYPGLEHFAAAKGYDVAEYTASACPPMMDFFVPQRPFCKSINDFVMQRIAQLKPDEVIFDSTWKYDPKYLHDGLSRTVQQLRAMNIRKIVLMGPPPGWLGEGLAANVLDYFFASGSRSVLPERTWYRSDDAWTRVMDAYQAKLARELGIDFISARSVFCNDEGCLARIGPNGADLTAFDTGHLTVPGSIFLVDHALDRLLDFKQ